MTKLLSSQVYGRLPSLTTKQTNKEKKKKTIQHPYQGYIWHQNFPILHPNEGNYPKWTKVVSGLLALEVGGTEQ